MSKGCNWRSWHPIKYIYFKFILEPQKDGYQRSIINLKGFNNCVEYLHFRQENLQLKNIYILISIDPKNVSIYIVYIS